MADFVFEDGREINFDLRLMTFGQYRGLFDPTESDEDSTVTLARVSGMTFEQVKDLSFPEYKMLFAALVKRAREPINSPNV